MRHLPAAVDAEVVLVAPSDRHGEPGRGRGDRPAALPYDLHQVGFQIVDDAGVIGAIFGVTGLQILQVAFVGAWVVSTGVVAALAGTVALLVSIPFLFIGVMTGLLPIAIFAIVASLLILVVIWVFWLRGT